MPTDCFDTVLPDSYNTRKIPRAEFIADIKAYVDQFDGDVAASITRLQESLNKYTFLFDALRKNLETLRFSVPELESNIEAIRYFQTRGEDEIPVTYELATGVYARATVAKREMIALWLGSRVMVEYSYDEAAALLEKNIEDANAAIEDLSMNLQFLKEQITTTEVSISRVFNWDVNARKEAPTIVEQ